MLAARAVEQRSRLPRFTRIASKGRLSTRGEVGETWRTKRWTPARWRDLSQSLDEKWANFDLSERDNSRFDAASKRLRGHLVSHPGDGCAQAALDRLTT